VTPSPFCFRDFSNRVSHLCQSQPGQESPYLCLPRSLEGSAYYHTQPFILSRLQSGIFLISTS
jgi:hypothetical protein